METVKFVQSKLEEEEFSFSPWDFALSRHEWLKIKAFEQLQAMGILVWDRSKRAYFLAEEWKVQERVQELRAIILAFT